MMTVSFSCVRVHPRLMDRARHRSVANHRAHAGNWTRACCWQSSSRCRSVQSRRGEDPLSCLPMLQVLPCQVCPDMWPHRDPREAPWHKLYRCRPKLMAHGPGVALGRTSSSSPSSTLPTRSTISLAQTLHQSLSICSLAFSASSCRKRQHSGKNACVVSSNCWSTRRSYRRFPCCSRSGTTIAPATWSPVSWSRSCRSGDRSTRVQLCRRREAFSSRSASIRMKGESTRLFSRNSCPRPSCRRSLMATRRRLSTFWPSWTVCFITRSLSSSEARVARSGCNGSQMQPICRVHSLIHQQSTKPSSGLFHLLGRLSGSLRGFVIALMLS
eukprot:m.810960 g.810960  ORF g.810960 m.810960 type:complete len:328 (+) comp59327_c0_seq6:1068-2051(+)